MASRAERFKKVAIKAAKAARKWAETAGRAADKLLPEAQKRAETEQLRVVLLGIRIRRRHHRRPSHHRFFVTGVIDQDLIPWMHRPQVADRHRILDTVPHRGFLTRHVVVAVGARLSFDQPIIRHWVAHCWIVSVNSFMMSVSVLPVRLGTLNEWSPSSMRCSVARSPRPFTTCCTNSSCANSSRLPCRNSIGTSTDVKCSARSIPGRPGACKGKPRNTRPRTPGMGWDACACEVIRPPNDLPPAIIGNPGAARAAAATALRTEACAKPGGSGRFFPACMYGNSYR